MLVYDSKSHTLSPGPVDRVLLGLIGAEIKLLKRHAKRLQRMCKPTPEGKEYNKTHRVGRQMAAQRIEVLQDIAHQIQILRRVRG